MTAIPFDTHGFVKELKSAGLDERQAEAIVSGVRSAQLSSSAELATKKDLSEMEARLTVRFMTMLGVAVALQSAIITLIKLFP